MICPRCIYTNTYYRLLKNMAYLRRTKQHIYKYVHFRIPLQIRSVQLRVQCSVSISFRPIDMVPRLRTPIRLMLIPFWGTYFLLPLRSIWGTSLVWTFACTHSTSLSTIPLFACPIRFPLCGSSLEENPFLLPSPTTNGVTSRYA